MRFIRHYPRQGIPIPPSAIRSVVFASITGLMASSCSAQDASPDFGGSDPLRARLDAGMSLIEQRIGAPSAQVAVVSGDQVLWSRAFGERSDIDDVYMIASVQKVLTAASVLQLVDSGAVDLDSDISTYLPFEVRNPESPSVPITVRMLLTHRSGLDNFPDDFDWSTQCSFSPRFRQRCNREGVEWPLGDFLEARLTPGTPTFSSEAWAQEPEVGFRYSSSAFLILRHLVGKVTGGTYADYVRQYVFEPLGMQGSGFSAGDFGSRHAVPYTRIAGEDVELPVWEGNGHLTRTTAGDLARFMIPFLNEGRVGETQFLDSPTMLLMMARSTSFPRSSRGNSDLAQLSHGLGLFRYERGWFGYGGSVPGFQVLWRFSPSRGVGYVIMANVNGILLPGEDLEDLNSARREIYAIQDELLAILETEG